MQLRLRVERLMKISIGNIAAGGNAAAGKMKMNKKAVRLKSVDCL